MQILSIRLVLIEKRRFISLFLPFQSCRAFLDEDENIKKTPLFEQDTGMYMSISFHYMIDERERDKTTE